MAGKFLLIEEAARQLGVSVDEVHRLVERKKLYPLRDGTALKFKIEEIERLSAEAADAGEPSGLGLELDLDDVAAGPAHESIAAATPPPSAPINGPGQTVDLDLSGIGLADESPTGGGGGSGLALAGESIFGGGTAAQDDLAQTMLGTGEAIGLDAMDLDLDSIVGLSSPSLAASASAPSVSLDKSVGKPAAGKPAAPADSGTLAIDLSGIGIGSRPSNPVGSNATGSLVLGSDIDPAVLSGPLTNAGAALSGALDSGLSLEDGDAAVSGIDIGMLDDSELDEDGATALGGDEFDLGDPDEDDGSVVAVEPESGDSSFYPLEASESSDDFNTGTSAGAAANMSGLDPIEPDHLVRDIRFSVWQICGLVCCALLLLTGGFVMFDLMRTIGSPGDLSLSSPLLNPLSTVFGWR
jgi:excisionase family DNA binding protein